MTKKLSSKIAGFGMILKIPGHPDTVLSTPSSEKADKRRSMTALRKYLIKQGVACNVGAGFKPLPTEGFSKN